MSSSTSTSLTAAIVGKRKYRNKDEWGQELKQYKHKWRYKDRNESIYLILKSVQLDPDSLDNHYNTCYKISQYADMNNDAHMEQILNYLEECGLLFKQLNNQYRGLKQQKKKNGVVKAWYYSTEKGKRYTEIYERMMEMLPQALELRKHHRNVYY